uniref:SET domain-containing protein n=1 Tax=Chromera velia CCMP2878 TaxID=1169474 RepID=A0A0G4HTZ2_9ALVE|eukprot:Cvel_8557.t1-p1 / transcript=Cvel_8557.t1 / gene=Cvel_8557 / organism=Chromera_velia_CCMP2878 / gene_product=hypothetical protein / transcript_product=hypothetical protein / location=Cvel_scaffold474:80563-83691(+) / protein_length=537 / sequence_SO=supercontig / SO=protein_coding / is_pseudo=false
MASSSSLSGAASVVVRRAESAALGRFLETTACVPSSGTLLKERPFVVVRNPVVPVEFAEMHPSRLQTLLENLQSEPASTLYPRRLETAALLAKAAHFFSWRLRRRLSLETLQRLCRLMMINGYGWPFGQLPFSQAIFLEASFLTHSCRPNAWVHLREDEGACVTALRDIEKGERVESSYLPLHVLAFPRHVRRERLGSSKLFLCSCERCQQSVDTTRAFGCRCGGSLFSVGSEASSSCSSSSSSASLRKGEATGDPAGGITERFDGNQGGGGRPRAREAAGRVHPMNQSDLGGHAQRAERGGGGETNNEKTGDRSWLSSWFRRAIGRGSRAVSKGDVDDSAKFKCVTCGRESRGARNDQENSAGYVVRPSREVLEAEADLTERARQLWDSLDRLGGRLESSRSGRNAVREASLIRERVEVLLSRGLIEDDHFLLPVSAVLHVRCLSRGSLEKATEGGGRGKGGHRMRANLRHAALWLQTETGVGPERVASYVMKTIPDAFVGEWAAGALAEAVPPPGAPIPSHTETQSHCQGQVKGE